jgi:starvation-inducible DNA-binding protein
MNDLIEKLNVLLATSFTMYLKTHFFHWNMRGSDFFEYHNFFDGLYNDIWASVDTTAEEIKAIDGVAYGSLTQYQSISKVTDHTSVPTIQEMVSILARDNETVIAALMAAHQSAEMNKQYGLINYLEDRIDKHKKHGWMLKASMAPASAPTAVKEEAPAEEEMKTYALDVKNL